MQKILTDVDSVLLDWQGSFETFLRNKGVEVPDRTQTDWGLHLWLGVEREIAYNWVNEFNASEMFANLMPELHAVDCVTSLSEHYDFVAISSCGIEPGVKELREQNLKSVFGPVFSEVICVPVGLSKREFLEKYHPTFWIEDKDENAVVGSEVGHTAILLNKPYNTNFSHPNVLKLNNWLEVETFIRSKR